jgi:hypothetical protein
VARLTIDPCAPADGEAGQRGRNRLPPFPLPRPPTLLLVGLNPKQTAPTTGHSVKSPAPVHAQCRHQYLSPGPHRSPSSLNWMENMCGTTAALPAVLSVDAARAMVTGSLSQVDSDHRGRLHRGACGAGGASSTCIASAGTTTGPSTDGSSVLKNTCKSPLAHTYRGSCAMTRQDKAVVVKNAVRYQRKGNQNSTPIDLAFDLYASVNPNPTRTTSTRLGLLLPHVLP